MILVMDHNPQAALMGLPLVLIPLLLLMIMVASSLSLLLSMNLLLLQLLIILGTIDCFGGTTTIVISATGGTAPYSGDGTYTVSAGPYSLLQLPMQTTVLQLSQVPLLNLMNLLLLITPAPLIASVELLLL